MTPPAVGSDLSGVLADWGDELTQNPGNGSHWLTYWSRLNQQFTGGGAGPEELRRALLSESISERLLIHFLELKGIRVAEGICSDGSSLVSWES